MPLSEELAPGTPNRAMLLSHLLSDHGEQYEEGFIEYAVSLGCSTTEELDSHHVETHADDAEMGFSEPASPAHLKLEGEPNYLLGGPAHT